MKEFLKRHLPAGLRRRLRGLGRCRWITKYRLLHAYGARFRSSPLTAARFVLFDPEVESHSFDIYADTGWAVLPELRAGWKRMIASTFDTMEETLAGLEVDLLIRDTPPMHEHVRLESEVAARHSGRLLTVIDSAGEGATPLQELSQRMGGSFRVFAERTRKHVQRENHQAYARLPRRDKTLLETATNDVILAQTTR